MSHVTYECVISCVWMSHVTHTNDSGWRRLIGSLIFICHFQQKWPIIRGSCMCMCVCTHLHGVSLHTCTHTQKHTHKHTHAQPHTCTHTHIRDAGEGIQLLFSIDYFLLKSPIYLWKSPFFTHAYTHTNTHTHTYTRTHLHIHTHAQVERERGQATDGTGYSWHGHGTI